MRLFLKIFTILLFSQLLALTTYAACLDNAGKEVFVNGKPATTDYCCKNYASSNTSLCTNSGSNNNTQTVELTNPLANAGVNSVQTLIGRIINTLLGVVGSLALIMFIYGGFTWMLAAGNESNVQKGKNILIWAIIGMVVIFASYSIVHFVLRSVTQ